MVWPCKALGMTPQTSFTCQNKLGEDQLDDLEGPITLRILNGIAWDFIQAKYRMRWKTLSVVG